MRKIPVVIIACLLALIAQADPVTQQQALNKAQSFLSGKRSRKTALSDASLQLVSVHHYQVSKEQIAPCFYVFNVGDDGGFVVVSGDDLMPTILGYADRGTYDEATMPENMKAWMEGYSQQMAWLHSHPEAAAHNNVVAGDAISPLLHSTWGQSSPYNDLCPMNNGSRSMTGCVATAMAQVMYYYQWPSKTTKVIPSYTTQTKGIAIPAIPAGTVIDWDNILPAYTGSESSVQQQAVAQLMKLCGTSIETDYSCDSYNESGAYISSVVTGLINYFDYDASITCESANEYTLGQWSQMVYNELAAGRPVIYSGSERTSGHVFVVDGYGGDGFFHVNWGWYGSCDNYFLLSVLDSDISDGVGVDSSIDGFSLGQAAIFGVQPNTGKPKEEIVRMTTHSMSLPNGNYFTRSSSLDDFSFQVDADMWNLTGSSYTFDCAAFGFFDESDNLLSVASDYREYTFTLGQGFNTVPRTVNLGAGITSGKYKIKAISRKSGTTTWYANNCDPSCFINVVISGNTIRLIAPTVDLSGTITATGNTVAMSRVPLDITITNNGSFFCEQVYLLDGKTFLGGRLIEIEAGATETLSFSFIPTTAGTKRLSLCTYKSGFIPFATCDVAITAPTAADLSITSHISNATNGIVKDNKFVISANVKNNGSSTYNNYVMARLYKMDDEGLGTGMGQIFETLSLRPGQNTNVELTFNHLEDGATYYYYMYYYSEGELIRSIRGDRATVNIDSETHIPGDVNGDGMVNGTDLVALVNIIMGQQTGSNTADVNGDGTINGTDLVALVNKILNAQ